MNLYKIERTDSVGYDEFDAAVVFATSAKEAIKIQPSEFSGWSTSEDNLKVTLIAELKVVRKGFKRGVVLASFRAG